MAKLKCPKCKGSHIQLISTDNNMKVKSKTTINLNPLHPLTFANATTVKKEKTSAGKVALGIMTGGLSTMFTGTKHKNHNEYFCQDCGHRWIGK